MRFFSFFSRNLLLFYTPLFLFLGSSCHTPAREKTGEAKADSSAQILYAKNFRIDYYPDHKRLTLSKAFQHPHEPLVFILIPRGAQAPSGFSKEQIIEIPLRSIAALSHTHLAMLEQLGALSALTGLSQSAYLPDEDLLKAVETGKIKDLGTEGGGLNEELLLALSPEVLMESGFSQEAWDKRKQVCGEQIKVVVNAEWLEETPLGRAEWIKFIAAFFDKDREAQTLFAQSAQQYEALRKKTASVTQKPKVLWEMPYKDTWYVPYGNSYAADLLKDAGAHYYWKDEKGSGSLALDFESVYAKAQTADFWINVGLNQSLKDLKSQDERLADFAPFQTGQVYNNTRQLKKNGGNPYWTRGVSEPEVILADLIHILHPELLPEHELKYFQLLK